MDIFFLFPTIPNPRIIKRIYVAIECGETELFFWDRMLDERCENTIPNSAVVKSYKQLGNDGQPLKRIFPTIKFAIAAYREMRALQPKVVHVAKTDLLLLTHIYCLARRNKPYVIYEVSDMHDLMFNSSTSLKKKLLKWFLSFLEKISSKYVKKLIVTSPYFWTHYYSKFYTEEKVLFIPNFQQLGVFNNFKKKSSGKYTVGYIGIVGYYEQLKMLVDIAEKLEVHVFIAGYGIARKRLLEYVANRSHVTFYGEYNYFDEIADLYSRVDCIFSQYNTLSDNVRIALPNRLYEAACCGLPLIVSKDTALAQEVEQNELGIAVEDGNADELTQAISTLARQNFDYQEKGKLYIEGLQYNKTCDALKETYIVGVEGKYDK